MKRSSTAAERQYLASVAALGCIVCSHCYGFEDTPAQVHHVRVSHGWGRTSHFMTIPLCEPHHTGKLGVHSMGRDEFELMTGYSEIRWLEIVQHKLGVE